MSFLEVIKHYPILILFIVAIPVIIMDIWAVHDIAKYSYKQRDKKWAWTNAILFFPLLGVFAYIFYGKKLFQDES